MTNPLPILLRSLQAGLIALALPAHGAPGNLDVGFGTGGKVTTSIGISYDEGNSVAVQSDGKIVVAGNSSNDGNTSDFALVRYTASGALDTGFGTGGKVTTPIGSNNDYAASMAVQRDGKIVVAGFSYIIGTNDFALVRYVASGALDTSFGTGGKVTTAIGSSNDYGYSMAVQSDGKIVVAGFSFNGSNNDFALVRYTAGGALDTGFGTGGKVTTPIGSGNDQAYGVAMQSDGKIVVTGFSDIGGFSYDVALVRYLTSGALDTSFGTGGKVITPVGSSDDLGHSVAVQSDGKIVVAANSWSGGSAWYDFALMRYTANGALDTGFGTGGKITTPIGSGDDQVNSMAVQSDGKIVVAGSSNIGNYHDFALARFTANGALDTGFGTGGKVTTPIGSNEDRGYSVAVQSDGKIVVSGYIYYGAANSDIALVRYDGGPPPDNDADGLLDQWEFNNWGTAVGHGPLDDFDHDGYCEQLELALGLNPTLPNAGGLPTPTNEGGYLTMTITKQSGVTYEVQSAGSLLPALPDSFSAATTTVLTNNATTLKVRDNFLISAAPGRFMRVKVTAAP